MKKIFIITMSTLISIFAHGKECTTEYTWKNQIGLEGQGLGPSGDLNSIQGIVFHAVEKLVQNGQSDFKSIFEKNEADGSFVAERGYSEIRSCKTKTGQYLLNLLLNRNVNLGSSSPAAGLFEALNALQDNNSIEKTVDDTPSSSTVAGVTKTIEKIEIINVKTPSQILEVKKATYRNSNDSTLERHSYTWNLVAE